MFEQLKNNIHSITDKIHQSASGVSDVYNDLKEIHSLFISIRDVIVSLFSFMGHETAVLLFFSFLFLLLINLLPFFFFDKKQRYYVSIGFGVILGVWLSYTFWSCLKYIAIMLIPVGLDFLLAWICRKTFVSTKKIFSFLVKTGKELLQNFFKSFFAFFRKKKNKDDAE